MYTPTPPHSHDTDIYYQKRDTFSTRLETFVDALCCGRYRQMGLCRIVSRDAWEDHRGATRLVPILRPGF